MPAPELREGIKLALSALTSKPLKTAATELFAALGYHSGKTASLSGTPAEFLSFADPSGQLETRKDAHVDYWREVQFLFQLTNDELPTLAQGEAGLLQGAQPYRTSIIESFVFLALDLNGRDWTRGSLAGITREINKLFPMPVVVFFRHEGLASLAVIDRRAHKLDASRDVITRRISIIKDIELSEPHRAHLDILCGMGLTEVKVPGRGRPTNFRDLYEGWMEALSVQTLNRRFYKELANWFFWSVKQVTFPAAAIETNDESRAQQNQIAVIRLLTRLIFVWFIKQKRLVPDALFEPHELRKLLVDDPTQHPDDSTYYKAVLQNLFFATLNTEMSDERAWRSKSKSGGLDGHYLVHTLYRFQGAFRDPGKAMSLFKQVPFLNGGLFECLDREVSDRELQRNPELKQRITYEGSRQVIRIDGFSERTQNPLVVPNRIFFAESEQVDLNEEYQTKGKTENVVGLVELFAGYKFTVEENTPVEEEVALDPELLGKVFENLLASYNPDTKATARKKSGSFYTPRYVVDYMVDEALVAYFDQQLPDIPELELRLRALLAPGTDNPFYEGETEALITAVDNLKALDPACGSGAFPMGLLQKLIHILGRLDPHNTNWKAQNRRPLEEQFDLAKQIRDPSRREGAIEEAQAALDKLDHDFSDANLPDYSRKLYLIDKCLFGVDIQPIAVQIAKLRFFISLVVSQKIDRDQPNLNITALPNLETRLVAANTLIPIERKRSHDLFRNDKIGVLEAELQSLNERYFSARTAKAKRARREDIGRVRDELADLLKADLGLPEAEARKMATWDPFDQNAAATFFDPEWMFALPPPSDASLASGERIGPFNLVIGNPPYVRQEEITDQKPRLEKIYGGKDPLSKLPIGAYAGTADLLVYFIQRGIELLSPGGAFSYITSNKWYRAKYGTNLRGWLNRHTRLRRVLDFGDAEVFEAIAYPTVLVATRRDAPIQQARETDTLRVMNWPAGRDRSEIDGFPELVEAIGFNMPQRALLDGGWQLEPDIKRSLLERIRAAGVPLGQHVEGRFYYGIKTGYNDAFVITGQQRAELLDVAEQNNRKGRPDRSAEIIKPFLRGRDIKRWRVEPDDLWLIFTRHGIDIDSVPAVGRHLIAHRDRLEPKPTDWNIKRNGKWEGRKAGSYKWYEIQDNVAYWEEFERPKIVYPDIYEHQSFAWDTSGGYGANTCYFIPTNERWLTGVLNSKVIEWFYGQISNRIRGGYLRSFSDYMQQVPIPRGTPVQRELVDCIVAVQSEHPDARMERLLNGFVYELFFGEDLHARGLTLFDEAAEAGLRKLSGLDSEATATATKEFCDRTSATSHPLYAMLFDLQALDVVRIVEGDE